MMPESNAKPRRSWFQFSLLTLLIAVTLAAGMLAAWRNVYVVPYLRQLKTMKLIEELGGKYTVTINFRISPIFVNGPNGTAKRSTMIEPFGREAGERLVSFPSGFLSLSR